MKQWYALYVLLCSYVLLEVGWVVWLVGTWALRMWPVLSTAVLALEVGLGSLTSGYMSTENVTSVECSCTYFGRRLGSLTSGYMGTENATSIECSCTYFGGRLGSLTSGYMSTENVTSIECSCTYFGGRLGSLTSGYMSTENVTSAERSCTYFGGRLGSLTSGYMSTSLWWSSWNSEYRRKMKEGTFWFSRSTRMI